MILFSGFETTFSMFAQSLFDYSSNQISWLFVFTGVVGLIVQGYISRRSSTKFVGFTVCGLLLLAGSFIGLAFSFSIGMLLLFLGVLSAGVSLVMIYMPSLLTYYASEEKRGVIMGVYEGLGSLGRVVGPLLAYSFPLHLIRTEYFSYGIILTFIASGLYFLSLSFNKST